MPYAHGRKDETLTIRIDPALKAALTSVAEDEAKPLGALLRELIQDRVERKRRQDFEAEARRQSAVIAAAASDPTSDEAAILRELSGAADELLAAENGR